MTPSGIICASKLTPGKIVILSGAIAASGEEAVAIAIRGQENGVVLGEPAKRIGHLWKPTNRKTNVH